jgi:tetratricopeptide (TPR) repeat protein
MLRIAIRAAEYRIGLPSTSNTPDHSAWYDLGASVHLWALRTLKEDKLGPLVIKYFSKAVKHDPGNDKYWVALGLAYFTTTPRAAQHAFVKALEIDGKNAQTWATLGLLYLHHGDVDLAEEVLQRAQTLDPDCTVAWVGQAVAAELRGERAHADALFVHATTLDEILVSYKHWKEDRADDFLSPRRIIIRAIDCSIARGWFHNLRPKFWTIFSPRITSLRGIAREGRTMLRVYTSSPSSANV